MDEFGAWLETVANGNATMSQRRVAWAEQNGGLDKLVSEAQSRGVHLVKLTDDQGHELLVASVNPFTTLC